MCRDGSCIYILEKVHLIPCMLAGGTCGGCQLIAVKGRCAGHSALCCFAADRAAVAGIASKGQAVCKCICAMWQVHQASCEPAVCIRVQHLVGGTALLTSWST